MTYLSVLVSTICLVVLLLKGPDSEGMSDGANPFMIDADVTLPIS